MGLGGDIAYIDREGGTYTAFFYSGGDTYRYGTDADKSALKTRLERAGFTRIVDICKNHDAPDATELFLDKYLEDL